MASVETNSYQGRYLKLTVTEENTSITNNTSTIRWTLESIGGSSTYYTIFNCSVIVNGDTVYDPGTVRWDSYEFPAKKGSISDTMTIQHKPDGTADPVEFELHGKVYISGDEDLHGTLNLSTIPRQTTITTFTVSKRDETSLTFNWSTADTIDYAWYSTNNGTNWAGYDVTDGTSGSFTVSKLSSNTSTNLSPNTSYSCKLRVRRKDSQINTDSGTVSQTTYNYPSITNVGTTNLTIGNSQTLTLYNPLSRSVTIKMHKDSTSGTQLYSGTTSGTSITFTPTASTLYASIPNNQSAKCVYSAIYSSSTKTVSGSYTYKIKNTEVPTFNNFTYQDTNTKTAALTGNNQILVNGYSNVTATISAANKATANNSATMKSYLLTIGTKTDKENYASSGDVNLSINNVNSGSISIAATDSRELSKVVTKTATFKNYSDLVIKSVTATRSNNGVGKVVTLSYNGTFWNASFGNTTNTIKTMKYYYKLTTASSWTTGTTTLTKTVSGNNWNGSININGDLGTEGFNISNAYNIRLEVSDELSTKTFDVTLTSGTPAMAIYKGNIAIGKKYDTSQGCTLQVGGNEIIDGRSYFEGKIRNKQGSYVEYFNAGAGTAGYIKICTLTIGGTYVNQPIIFGVIQRTRYGRIILQFKSSSDIKPDGFTVFQSSGSINPYIVKTGDSTWDLYIQKSEAYDNIEITELYKGEYQNSITITWKNEIAASLPSGAVNAGWEEYGINARYATTAGNLSDANSYTYSGVRDEDWGSTWLRTHSFIGSLNNSGWRSIINVRHRGGASDGNNYGLQIIDNAMTSATWEFLVRKQYGGTWTGWETISRRVNLYNNTSGATGTITLSQSAANFNYIIIFYRNDDNEYGERMIYGPNGKITDLSCISVRGGNLCDIKNRNVKINGTSIATYNDGEANRYGEFVWFESSTQEVNTNNKIYITRVDGYK